MGACQDGIYDILIPDAGALKISRRERHARIISLRQDGKKTTENHTQSSERTAPPTTSAFPLQRIEMEAVEASTLNKCPKWLFGNGSFSRHFHRPPLPSQARKAYRISEMWGGRVPLLRRQGVRGDVLFWDDGAVNCFSS